MNEIIINTDNKDIIITKSLDGTISAEESLALDVWMNASADNQHYYTSMRQINEMYLNNKVENIDVDSAWQKVKAVTIDSENNRSIHQWRWMAYAASFISILAVGFWLVKSYAQPDAYIGGDHPMEYALEDGSQIILEKNSALSRLESSQRAFSFSGKAKFKVEHHDSNPFVLHINKVRIKDLGTIFNVDARPDTDTVLVKVSEGLVQFYTLGNNGMELHQGEEAIYIISRDKFLKRSIDHLHPQLTTSFQNAPLSDVIEYMAYAFRKSVIWNDEQLGTCNITVDFDKADYLLVKEIIQETLGIKITDKSGEITISGNSCK